MLRQAFVILFLCVVLGVYSIEFRTASMQSDPIRRMTHTPEAGLNLNPSLSGDGRQLAFEASTNLAGSGGENGFRVFSCSVENEPTLFNEISFSRAIAPALSQDGTSIAFASKGNPLGTNSDGNSEIFQYTSGQLRQITHTLPDDIALRHIHGNFQPSITDDGGTVVFASNRQLTVQNNDANLEIILFDTAINSFTQLTNSTGVVGATDAKISGDGSHIAYVVDHGAMSSARRDLMLEDMRTQETRVIASNVNELEITPGRAISDDGLRVVYSSETTTDASQVFLYDGRNNLTRQLTSLAARAEDVALHATISGDGKRVSFATRRTVAGVNTDNSVELYTFDIPTAQLARVTSAPAFATSEVISSLNDDGSLVAFNFPRVLSGTVSSSALANNSEIYLATTEIRPPYSSNLAIQNGASFGHEDSTFDAVAPDSVAVAWGNALAFDTLQATPLPNGSFPTILGGTTVSVNNRFAELFSVSPTHVSFHVPPETETTFAQVRVTNSEGFETRGTIRVLRAAPGIFTETADGLGAGVIRDAQTGNSGPFDPTSGPQSLIVHTTGVRGLSSQIAVTIGARIVPFESLARSDQTPGLDLIRVQLPRDLRGAGSVIMTVRAGRRESNPVTLIVNGNRGRDVFVNEVLADPPDGIAGDANHDGVRSGTDDEFIELVNSQTDDVNISGWKILTRAISGTTETTRHVFATGTVISARDAIVVFGGGTFASNHGAFGGAQVLATSTAGLSLTNSGLTILVRDAAGHLITEVSYGGSTGLDGSNNQSLTRWPDIDGSYVQHTQAFGAGSRAFSPGTLLDGSFFIHHESYLTNVNIAPSEMIGRAGQRVQFVASAFDQFGRRFRNAAINFELSNPRTATIDSVRVDRISGTSTATVLCIAEGVTAIRATATAGNISISSLPSSLIVSPPPQIPIAGQVIINEVLASFTSGTPTRTDFVELYNTTNQPLDISGLVISFRGAGNTSAVTTITLPGVTGSGFALVSANGYYLVANGPSTFGVAADFDASATGLDINNSSGAVKIEINGLKLDGLRYQQNGSASPPTAFDGFGEGTLFGFAGGTPNDLVRSPNGVDSNNNGSDFRRNNSHAAVSPRSVNPLIP